MSINITQLLLDIKTHVVNTVKNDLEDRMKLFINDLIENNKSQINKDSVNRIKEQLEGKDPLEILKLSKKFISKKDWVPAIGKKPEFMALVEKLNKNPDAGNKKPAMETVQTGGDLDSTIDTASQTIGDAIKIAPQKFVSAFERYVKTYENANLKMPQDPARQVSDAILALVNTAVQTRRQNTIDSLIAIANEGIDKDGKIVKADSFRGTVKMKIEDKIINESLQPWDMNQDKKMNIIMNDNLSEEVKKRVIDNNLIHKSYGNNPQVTATIDRYFNKLEKVGSNPTVENDPIREAAQTIGNVMGISKGKDEQQTDKNDKGQGEGNSDTKEITAEKQQEMNQKAIESLSQTLETIYSPKSEEIIQILKDLPPETTVEEAMVKIKEKVNDPAIIEKVDAKAEEVKIEMQKEKETTDYSQNKNEEDTKNISSEEFDKEFKSKLAFVVSDALETVIANTKNDDVKERATAIKNIMDGLEQDQKVGSIIDTNNPLYTEYKETVCKDKREDGLYCISNDIIESFIKYVHLKVKDLENNENVNKSVVIDFKLLGEVNDVVNSSKDNSNKSFINTSRTQSEIQDGLKDSTAEHLPGETQIKDAKNKISSNELSSTYASTTDASTTLAANEELRNEVIDATSSAKDGVANTASDVLENKEAKSVINETTETVDKLGDKATDLASNASTNIQKGVNDIASTVSESKLGNDINNAFEDFKEENVELFENGSVNINNMIVKSDDYNEQARYIVNFENSLTFSYILVGINDGLKAAFPALNATVVLAPVGFVLQGMSLLIQKYIEKSQLMEAVKIIQNKIKNTLQNIMNDSARLYIFTNILTRYGDKKDDELNDILNKEILPDTITLINKTLAKIQVLMDKVVFKEEDTSRIAKMTRSYNRNISGGFYKILLNDQLLYLTSLVGDVNNAMIRLFQDYTEYMRNNMQNYLIQARRLYNDYEKKHGNKKKDDFIDSIKENTKEIKKIHDKVIVEPHINEAKKEIEEKRSVFASFWKKQKGGKRKTQKKRRKHKSP